MLGALGKVRAQPFLEQLGLGRGVEQGCDVILAVLDPTYESLQLSKKIIEISGKIGKDLYFVLNRVDKDSKEAMLKSVDKDRVAAFVPEDKRIFMTGLSGDDIDLQIDEIEQLADFLEARA